MPHNTLAKLVMGSILALAIGWLAYGAYLILAEGGAHVGTVFR